MVEQDKPLCEQIDVVKTLEKSCVKTSGGTCAECKWTCAVDTRRQNDIIILLQH